MGAPGLVVFHRNDIDGFRRLKESLADVVAGIWVLDSSDPEEGSRFRVEFGADPQLHLHRLLPLGCTELYWPFVETWVGSERLLVIDTDEDPMPGLRERLEREERADVAFIARVDATTGFQRYLPRCFRKGSLRYDGWIHESPAVQGTSTRWGPQEGLVHRTGPSAYLMDRERGRRYLPIESVERPFTAREAWGEFHNWGVRALDGRQDRTLSWLAAHWLFYRLAHAPVDRARPIGPQRLHKRRFSEYQRARYREFRALSDVARVEAVAIAAEIRSAGGPTSYLGLDDASRFERLTASFPWDSNAGATLLTLIEHRHRTGHVSDQWPTKSSAGPSRDGG